jgi:hypothetical protein
MLHRYEKLRKEIENAVTATETRVEWKREAVEKAAKVAEASTTAIDSQPSAIASNLKLRK